MYGRIEMITGPMFSGKTTELMRRLRRLSYAKIEFLLFKPKKDARYSLDQVASHDGDKINSIVIDSAKEIMLHLKENKKVKVIAIDEVMFFDRFIIKVVDFLSENGYRVIMTGLDKNFKGEAYGPMKELICVADSVVKLTAICSVCGEDATMTQRMINDKPAAYNDKVLMVGSTECYEARCREHYEILGKPKLKLE